MDFFAILNEPKTFAFDPKALEAKFYALSREFHPDRFAQASEAARAESLEKMSALNEAYRLLRSPGLRREQLLREAGFLTSSKAKPSGPMLELAEAWFELQDDPDPARLQAFAESLEQADARNRQRMTELEAQIDAARDRKSIVELTELETLVQAEAYLASLKRDVAHKRK